jgi:hypothetical protein
MITPNSPTIPTVVAQFLASQDLEFEPIDERSIAVVVPGEQKLTTTVSLAFGETALTVNAFVIRHPDENTENVYRWLLERNKRMYGLAYSIDHLGDIYLTGRFPLKALDDQELDRIFGAISEYADGAFNLLLELGFASAIKREWQWRSQSGLPTDNLAAFRHLTEPRE